MNIKKTMSLTALALVLLGGGVFGISKIKATPVHAQTVAPQTQAVQQKDNAETVETKEGVKGTEPANEQAPEKNLPGGGHQDQGQVDHQFEGIE